MVVFPAVEYHVSGKVFYLGLISAKDFVGNYEVDAHSLASPEGYQRVHKGIRSKRFMNFVAKHEGFFHQTVLVNVRNVDQISFTPFQSTDFGTLTINEKFYVVDGQHRIGGIKALLEGEAGDKYENLPVPILVMTGAPRKEEALQFFLVNHTQEGVRAELGDTLIAKVIDRDKLTEDFQRDVLGSRGKIPLTQQAVELCEELNKNPASIWKDRIAYAQEKLDEKTAITQRGFTQSLKEVLRQITTQAIFGDENLPDALVNPLIDYWGAIHELCPEATGDGFKEHVLMKTTGAYIMHQLFPNVVLTCGPSIHKAKMKQILQNIEEMNDDDWHSDGDIGRSGAGHKVYRTWVKRFTKQIQQAKG